MNGVSALLCAVVRCTVYTLQGSWQIGRGRDGRGPLRSFTREKPDALLKHSGGGCSPHSEQFTLPNLVLIYQVPRGT